jgi:hypothetical protein
LANASPGSVFVCWCRCRLIACLSTSRARARTGITGRSVNKRHPTCRYDFRTFVRTVKTYNNINQIDRNSSLVKTLETRGMLNACNSGTAITPGRVEKCLFPETLRDATGNIVAARPASYKPPV